MERVTCDLQYSRAGEAFFLAAVGAVVAVAFALPLPAAGRVAFIAWAAAQACFGAVRLAAPRTMALDEEGRVEVWDGEGRRAGRLRPGSFVAPWLVIVRWRPDGSRLDRTVVLWPGRAPREALRRIRVILRWA